MRRLDPLVDLDLDADLAAISVSTKTARRAYQLAAAYRRAGVKVVLGGIHPTALPEEALLHADAVVVGEAEGQWERLLEDLRAGALRQRIYRREAQPAFETAARPRWSIFSSRRYVPIFPVQASRGCPYDCEFCSVSTFFGRRLRLRDVDDVAAEIARLPRRWVMFTDDNIVAGGERARRLFRALTPLRLTWFGQASLHGLRAPETIRLLARSGCKGLFVGFESVSAESLRGCGKHTQNDPARYVELVGAAAGRGDRRLGLVRPRPRPGRTRDLRAHAGAGRARQGLHGALRAADPLPRHAALRAPAGRGSPGGPHLVALQQPRDYPLFEPLRMSRQQLHEGWQWTWREFYGVGSIARRLARASALASPFSLLTYLPLNLHQRRLTRRKILGGERFYSRDH